MNGLVTLARGLGVLASIFTLLLMIFLVTNIVLRNGFNRSLPAFIEVIRASMVCIVFFGLAITDARDGHIRLTLLTDRLGSGAAAWVRVVGHSAVVFALAWMILATADRAEQSFAAREVFQGAEGLPLWPFRFVVVVGLVCALLIAFGKTVIYVRQALGDRGPAAASESMTAGLPG